MRMDGSTRQIWVKGNIDRAASWQKQKNYLCSQRRLRSAWASAQSDQSLRCPHQETLGILLPIERTAKTLIRLGGCPGWSFAGHTVHFVGFVMRRLNAYISWEQGNGNQDKFGEDIFREQIDSFLAKKGTVASWEGLQIFPAGSEDV